MVLNEDFQTRWWALQGKLIERFGKKPDLEAILYLIGIQELMVHKTEFTKEEKQDLMHIGICTVLASSGFYVLDGTDEEGWPHFTQLKELPVMDAIEQENFIKDHVVLYFDNTNF